MLGLVILAGVVFAYAIVAGLFDRLSITGPLVLMVAGLVVGPGGLDLVSGSVGSESVKTLTELALAVILFSDASSVSVDSARTEAGVSVRLLGIGLPLTIALGATACHLLFPSASWAICGLVGSLLAPTDAALGLAVVTNEAVPASIRSAINIESGLNDGLATPFVYFFLALSLSTSTAGHWVRSLDQVVAAIAIGLIVGLLLGRLAALAVSRGLTSARSRQLSVLIAGLFCYGLGIELGANGFVAAYVAGFAFTIGSKGSLAPDAELCEETGLYTSFAVWVLFGALLLGPVLRSGVPWQAVLYAVLSLTVIRMVPVALSLIGTGFHFRTLAFIGWFGPRGLASVVFTIVAIDSLPHDLHLQTVVDAATLTIALSVLLHGLTSRPLALRYGRSITADDPERIAGAEGKLQKPPLGRSLP